MSDIKLAVAGCGYWGKNHIRTLSELGVLHAVCDVSTAQAKHMVEQFDCLYLSQEDLLKSDVDGIVIATPAATHADWVRKALKHNKHVLVEKPLCLDAVEGTELLELAAEKNRFLMTGHLLRYHNGFRAVHDYVKAGKIGKLYYIKSNRLSHGKFRVEEDVWWSFAPHDISMVLALLQETPTDVAIHSGCYIQPQISDKVDATLRFVSGVEASIHVSWLSPYKEHRLTVVGEKGMMVFDDTLEWSKKVAFYQSPVSWSGDVPVANKHDCDYVALEPCEPLKEQAKHFIDCIKTGRKPITSGEEGLAVLEVLGMG